MTKNVTVMHESRRRSAKPRPPPPPLSTGTVISTIRVVDGSRSPFYFALKRRADLREHDGCYELHLGERRQVVIPWLSWPIFVYWRRRYVRSYDVKKLEVVSAAFLETGHVPAAFFL